MKGVSLFEAQMKIPDKLSCYKTLVMKDFQLPKFSDSIVTVEFLRSVMNGVCYCPKRSHHLDKPVAYPPTAELIKDEVIKLIEEK